MQFDNKILGETKQTIRRRYKGSDGPLAQMTHLEFTLSSW